MKILNAHLLRRFQALSWEVGQLPSGVYFLELRVQSGSFIHRSVRKLLLLR
jgi:hypothetical protein